MTPEEFVARWTNTTLGERQSYQAHFIELCQMLGWGAPTGSGKDQRGNIYRFEESIETGFADVYLEGHFAIEYKKPGKYTTLNAAYDQLLKYREQLHNPPLLIVTDIERWEIHTNFEGTEKRIYTFKHEDIATQNRVRDMLLALFEEPKRLHPRRNTADITKDAANGFQQIADNMRQWEAQPERIARFLTKLVFCLFAEDIHLLPPAQNSERGIFSEIVHQTRTDSSRFVRYAHELFEAMRTGGDVLMSVIPYFNGTLFDNVDVETLEYEALTELDKVASLNWASIEPAIFGTLFERALDKKKRAQLGAHYTSRDDILLIIEPVLMLPLRREWSSVKTQAEELLTKFKTATTPKDRISLNKQREQLRDGLLEKVRTITVLDPACGSGNFLYVALQSLMTLEKEIIFDPVWAETTRPMPQVHPRQMYGMEKDPIAHALASIVVWIGYIQWRKNNGYSGFAEPILEDLHDNIRNMDAILSYNDEGKPTEPTWQTADVIVGNPPFLGDKSMRFELGDQYTEDVRKIYKGRVPGGADLVTYWFEKARAQIEQGHTKRAGLLSTNSIRGGANREVLKRIKQTGDIFMGWADRAWILEGAAVRVSMVGFDKGDEKEKLLDGQITLAINSDLTGQNDITISKTLSENAGLAYIGTQKGGSFDIPYKMAQGMIAANPKNAEVIFPWVNGSDIVGQNRDMWIIDFGAYMSLEESSKYQQPFDHVQRIVYPQRKDLTRTNHRDKWWIHAESRPGMRQSLKHLARYICTPRVSKHRVFVWLPTRVLPDSATVAIARDDDYFFGVLHSKLHEVWSLRMGTWLGKGNDPRYTPTTTFETFPFPFVPKHEDFSDARVLAISAAAKQLHEERAAWLSLGGKERTLTNLYNALNVLRGVEKIRTVMAAGDFAPRLDQLHRALDAAVCAAYGWDVSILDDEEAILAALLALNLERSSE